MARSVKHPTLQVGSGHDLSVGGFEPHVGLCADSSEPAWDFLSLSLSLPLSLCSYPTHALSLKINLKIVFQKNQSNTLILKGNGKKNIDFEIPRDPNIPRSDRKSVV